MNGFDARRPKTVLRSLAAFLVVPVLSGTVTTATREEAMSVVDIDKLQWKDYPGLPGAAFTVVAGSNPGMRPQSRRTEAHLRRSILE